MPLENPSPHRIAWWSLLLFIVFKNARLRGMCVCICVYIWEKAKDTKTCTRNWICCIKGKNRNWAFFEHLLYFWCFISYCIIPYDNILKLIIRNIKKLLNRRNFNMKLKLEVNLANRKFCLFLHFFLRRSKQNGFACPGICRIAIHFIFLLLQVISLANLSYFLTNIFSRLFSHFFARNQVQYNGKCR